MTTKDTIRAFPGETVQKNGMHSSVRVLHGGMSLRDWFAGQALAGVTSQDSDTAYRAHQAVSKRRGVTPAMLYAQFAYECADAMLAARGADQ